MSVIIQNMGGNPLGVCKYQLRINREVIAEFEHSRSDGLEECLRAAADAAKKARLLECMMVLEEWAGVKK